MSTLDLQAGKKLEITHFPVLTMDTRTLDTVEPLITDTLINEHLQ
jgi:hypothetical protein